MQRLRNVVLGLAMWLLAAAPALAQAKGALEMVPADALGVGFINNLDKVSGKVEAMFKRLQVPLEGSPLKKIMGDLGVKGVNEKGSVVAAVFPGEKPVVVVIVPVSNFQDFADAAKAKDDSLAVEKKGDYAVVSEGANKELVKKIVEGQGGIVGAIKPLEGWMAKVDLGAVVTSKGVEFLVAKAREGLGEFKNQPLPDEAKFIHGYVDGIEQFLKKCAIEVTHVAIGGKFADKGDLVVDLRAVFAPEGPFAKFGAQVKAPVGGPLAGLPAGPFVIAAGGGGMGGGGIGMTKLAVDLIKNTAPDLPAEDVKKLETAMATMYQGVSGASFLMGVGKAGEAIFSGTMMVMKVDDSAAYMKRFKKATLVVNEVYKGGKVPGTKPSELKEVKVGQITALETTTDMSEAFDKIPGGLGGKIGEMIFGEGGKLRNSIVPADKNTVLIGYTSAAGMKSVLEAYQKKTYLGEDAEVLKTASMLPKGSQFAGYFSPKGTMELVNRAVGGFLPIQLPAFPDTPPVGFGLRLSGAGLEARVVVPASVQEGFGDLVQKIKQLIPGAN